MFPTFHVPKASEAEVVLNLLIIMGYGTVVVHDDVLCQIAFALNGPTVQSSEVWRDPKWAENRVELFRYREWLRDEFAF